VVDALDPPFFFSAVLPFGFLVFFVENPTLVSALFPLRCRIHSFFFLPLFFYGLFSFYLACLLPLLLAVLHCFSSFVFLRVHPLSIYQRALRRLTFFSCRRYSSNAFLFANDVGPSSSSGFTRRSATVPSWPVEVPRYNVAVFPLRISPKSSRSFTGRRLWVGVSCGSGAQ